MEGTQPDQESLMVLQALLKIRSESVCSDDSSGSNTVALSQTSSTTGAGVPNNNDPHHPVSSSSSSHCTPQPYLVSSFHNAPSTSVLGTTKPSTPQGGGDAAAMHSVLPVTGSTQPQQAPPLQEQPESLPVICPQQQQQQQHMGGSTRKRKKLEPQEVGDFVIRQDQIEAALRSKPQRGRKRENLSVLERLELTRTRNREHAKSTRIRKKARYQELLEKEQHYEAWNRVRNLNRERKDTILSFLSIRGSMTNNHNNKTQTPFQQPQQQTERDLCALFEDASSFWFHVHGAQATTTEADPKEQQQPPNGISDMEQVMNVSIRDKAATATTTYSILGKNAPLAFRVIGGAQAIAIGESHNALVHVSCDGQQRRPICTAMMQFQFAADSAKLRGVHWFALIDDDPANENHCPLQDSSALTSYPSVVSLDPVQQQQQQQQQQHQHQHQITTTQEGQQQQPPPQEANREGEGPGMSI